MKRDQQRLPGAASTARYSPSPEPQNDDAWLEFVAYGGTYACGTVQQLIEAGLVPEGAARINQWRGLTTTWSTLDRRLAVLRPRPSDRLKAGARGWEVLAWEVWIWPKVEPAVECNASLESNPDLGNVRGTRVPNDSHGKRGRPGGSAAARESMDHLNEVWTADGGAPLTFAEAVRKGLITTAAQVMPGLLDTVEQVLKELRQAGLPDTDRAALIHWLNNYAITTRQPLPPKVLFTELKTWQKELALARRASRTASKGKGKRAPTPVQCPLDEWLYKIKRS